MDEGWTRWLLEHYDFDFVILRPEDFQTPLPGVVDVVILAEDARIPDGWGVGRRLVARDGMARCQGRRGAGSFGPSTRMP